MKQYDRVYRMVLSAMFLALALFLPFLTGQIQQIGKMLTPMHFPVLLCGFFCGWQWGLLVGLIAPLLRSFLFGMPVFFPMAVCMSVELGCYGFLSGFLYRRLPKRKWSIYLSLVIAMILGRLAWGGAQWFCVRFHTKGFGLSAFLSGAFVTAVPGIVLQLLLIPLLVILLDKQKR